MYNIIMKTPATYIMANKPNGTLYTGVTYNLIQRVYQHRSHAIDGFTKKYDCIILVYFELHATMEQAIAFEKQIKAGSRADKIKLIELANTTWRDLYPEIV